MKDRWTELCELAVTELDRTKFRAILQELNQLLDDKSPMPRPRQEQWSFPKRKFDSQTPRSQR
jgi:hypothetical protein